MNANELAQGIITQLIDRDKKHIFMPNIDLLKRAVYKFKPPIIGPFPKALTTINNTIWLSRNFPNWAKVEQQAVLIHESVHLDQYAKGRLNLFSYLTSRLYRFEVEIAAETREILYRCYIGNIMKGMSNEYSINQANVWPAQYKLTSYKNGAEWYRIFRDIINEQFEILEHV